MIKNLPVRYPELGRLRLGDKETITTKAGATKEVPKKLSTWRVTSHDEVIVKAVASIYGGDVEAWADAPDGEQFQVMTESAEVDVLIPPDPLDLAYERWGSGGRQRRCDGETCMVALTSEGEDGAHFEEKPCWCAMKGLAPGDADAIKKGACDLVVRVKVVLPDVPGLGVFMLTTGSIYAAMELPGQVRLLERIGDAGVLIPASLVIEQRREKKAWEKYPREYPVPTLRVRRSMRQMTEQAGLEAGGVSPLALNPGGDTVTRESSRPSTIGDLPPTNQAVIYECSKAGVSDLEAHAVCRAITKDRKPAPTSSRKDLTTAECAVFLGALVDGSWRALAVAGDQPTTVHEAPAASGNAAEPMEVSAAEKPKGRPSALEQRVLGLQQRARALPAYLQDAMKAWLKAEDIGVLQDAPDRLDEVDARLTAYETQATEEAPFDDPAAAPEEASA